MTRDEVRKKAEEVADCYDYKRDYDASVRAFMSCYDWLTSGEPDGWECTLVNSRGEFNKFITFDSEEARIQGGGGWRIVPVKIVELEKK